MWELVLTLVPFAISMAATPGPNNVLVAASATNFGLRRTLPSVFGVVLGFGLMILLVGLGLGQVLERFPLLHTGLKYAGAAYLLYLAWRIANAGGGATASGGAAARDTSRPPSFIEGALFQWVNPKAWIVALGAIATYTVAEISLALQAMVIASVFVVVALPSVGAWALLGAGAARFLQTPRRLRAFNLAMASLLIFSIATLFL
ncbi:LysE family translocator [Dongia sp.]|uniref:LysE family translocator n=1 Tax=Dongia sp. TaxID=1977262 RepID=UPI0035ADFBDC